MPPLSRFGKGGGFGLGGFGTFGTFGKGGGLGNLPVLRRFYREHPYAEKYAKYREYAPGGSLSRCAPPHAFRALSVSLRSTSPPHVFRALSVSLTLDISPARGGDKTGFVFRGQIRHNTFTCLSVKRTGIL